MLWACFYGANGRWPFQRVFRTICSVSGVDLSAIGHALGRLAEEHANELPQSLDELAAPGAGGFPYMKAVPLDPWGREYVCDRGADGRAQIACAEVDGRERTQDDDAVIAERGPPWITRAARAAELRSERR